MATGVPARFSSLDGMDRARERCAHITHTYPPQLTKCVYNHNDERTQDACR